ncbi:MAG: hypothetical protein A3J28_18165 [Acidobacteria bacterium RIFCSPLOWO2_12_FULL_60_22]|nr:MAG: hypothetical protein A3J28_18165 [Acidobacteria bacterium RIFCSPLOWO2_12_FULL_60_22]
MKAVGEALRKEGLIETYRREFVRCADAQDSDYPPKNRHCQGRIYVDEALDEGGHDFRCPDCERPVFPGNGRKRRHTELQSKVRPEGGKAFITSKLTAKGVRQVVDGVYRVDIGTRGVFVCLADYCLEQEYLARDWAKTNATCYILVNAKRMRDRFLKEDWLNPVSLASVVLGEVDLSEFVEELSKGTSPAKVLAASVAVYDTGSRPIVIEPAATSAPNRQFLVEVGLNVVRVQGEVVVAPQSGTRFQVFKILWERFLEDLTKELPPEEFRAIPLEDLTAEIEKREHKPTIDELTVRRAINRLQEDIEKAVKKKTGLPIDREDIVQNFHWKRQSGDAYGYRLNPNTVAVRPYRASC